MTTRQIAEHLVTLLRAGRFEEIYDQLFHSEKVRHVEPQNPHFAEVIGVAAIREKDVAMQSGIASVGGMEVGEPAVAKDYFAVPYKMNFTLKDGTEVALDEIILYQVEDGKIILEQFFY